MTWKYDNIFVRRHNAFVATASVWILLFLSPTSSQELYTTTQRFNVADYEAPEPFPYLHHFCSDCLPQIDESPDPLVSYTWNAHVNTSQLQVYRTHQLSSYKVIPSHAISEENLQNFFAVRKQSSSTQNRTVSTSLKVYQNCTIILDWGLERAAWFELQMKTAPNANVLASLSEFNEPYPDKTRELTKYGDITYRLETNDELYEGVRFTFLYISFSHNIDRSNKPNGADSINSATPFPPCVEILDVSLVAKIKPIAYTGSFRSSNVELTKTWYTGAYGVRLNMEAEGFNSVLMERGDRVAIQGDGHPTIDTALVAFASENVFNMVKNVLQQTDSSHKHVVDDSIMAYPLYWCISAIDYYWVSGDHDFFVEQLTPDIQVLVDRRIDDFLKPDLDITWFGWDDRVGNGWCYHDNDKCNREAHLAFAALVIRVCNDFSRALWASGQIDLAKQYYGQSATMSQKLRQVPEYPTGFGVHAAANVLNAVGTATANETEYWMTTTLNDPITICSFSQFNQYWILQAFGNVGDVNAMEHALESIQLCWGTMMKLGKGCFWELSSPEWLRFLNDGDAAPHMPSYCHPWASGVTTWLSHVLGGLTPATPGYTKFAALPYVSSTHPSVSTRVETPEGTILVNVTLRDDLSIEMHVDSPVSGIVGLRSEVLGFHGALYPLATNLALVNGVQAKPISYQKARQVLQDKVGSEGAFFFLWVPGGASSVIEAKYGPFPRSNVLPEQASRYLSATNGFPELKYPATIDLDRSSQGNGLNTYGKDGYILFGCGEGGGDIEQLPQYVANLTAIRHGFPGYINVRREFVGYSDTNPVYLPLSRHHASSLGQRGLGRINLEDKGAGDLNCILLDVTISNDLKPGQFMLSVYFGAESKFNRHAIRIMDGDTFNLIAPTPLIDDYVDGVWLTVRYNKSIRLKFLDMKGILISAVAFSSR